MNRKLIMGIVLAVVLIAGGILFVRKSSEKLLIENNHFSLVESDLNTITWKIQPLYTDDAKIKEIEQIIEKLKSGDHEYDLDAYTTQAAIAQQYQFLGRPKEMFHFLLKAMEVDPQKSLAYMNMGNLLENINAKLSARKAYEKAISVEPQHAYTHLALLEFETTERLKSHEEIDALFREALYRTGTTTNVLKEYANFLEETGKYRESLEQWREVLKRSNEIAVRQKITELQAKINAR